MTSISILNERNSVKKCIHCGAWMGPGPYFIGNPGEIKDNRGSDKIPGRQSGSWGLQQCNVYSGGGCTVQYSTVQYGAVSGARRAEQGALAGIEWHSLSDSTETRRPVMTTDTEIKMIGLWSGTLPNTRDNQTWKVLWESDKNAEQNCGIWIFRWQDMPYRTCENKTSICPDKIRIMFWHELSYTITISNNYC